MFGPAATAGFMKENERIDRRRSELAQAFNQFRQTNPHATIDELQMFLDQNNGGSSWLYGTPSRQALEQVAQGNQQRKLQHDARVNLEQAAQQAQLHGSLLAQAEKIAGMTDDPTVAYAQFDQLFGNNPMARQLVRPEMFAGMQNRQNSEFVQKNLDVAIRALENGQDLSTMFPGMPKSRIDLLKSNAEPEFKRRKEDREREIETRETDRAQKLAAVGSDYTLPSYIDPNTPLGKSILSTAGRVAEARRRELVGKEADELRTKSPELQSRILAGDREAARQIVIQRIQALAPGRAPTPEEIEMVMSSLVASAQGLQTTNRQKAVQDIDKTATESVATLIRERQNSADATLGNQKLVTQRFGSGPIAEVLVRTLRERKLPLSGELINAMGEVVKSSEFQRQVTANGQLPTSDAIMAALQANPVIGPRLREETNAELLTTRERELRRRQMGLFDQQKAEDYVASYTQNLARTSEGLARQIEAKVAATLSDRNITPEIRRQRLLQERERLVTIERNAESELASRLRHTQNWQDVGGRAFTGQDVEQLQAQLRSAMQPLIARVEAALQSLPAPEQGRTMAPGGDGQQPATGNQFHTGFYATPGNQTPALRPFIEYRPDPLAPRAPPTSLNDLSFDFGASGRFMDAPQPARPRTPPSNPFLSDEDVARYARTPTGPEM